MRPKLVPEELDRGRFHYSQNQVLLAFTDPIFAKAQINFCVNKQEALVKQNCLHVTARMLEAPG